MKTFDELLKEFSTLHESIGMLEDVKILYKYVTEKKFKNVLELGILHGNTCRTFACAAATLPDTHITSVDIEQGCVDVCKEKITHDGTYNYVTFYQSDSVKFLNNQPYYSFDCIFIDTDHRLTQTLAELFLAGTRVLQDGGHIFMHDTGMLEVQQAIDLFKHYRLIEHTRFQTPAGLDLIVLRRTI
jgi:predicted O-methyltransferase YrrM